MMAKKHKHCWHGSYRNGGPEYTYCCYENTIKEYRFYDAPKKSKYVVIKHSRYFWLSLFNRVLE